MDEAVVRPHPEPWNKGKLVGVAVATGPAGLSKTITLETKALALRI